MHRSASIHVCAHVCGEHESQGSFRGSACNTRAGQGRPGARHTRLPWVTGASHWNHHLCLPGRQRDCSSHPGSLIRHVALHIPHGITPPSPHAAVPIPSPPRTPSRAGALLRSGPGRRREVGRGKRQGGTIVLGAGGGEGRAPWAQDTSQGVAGVRQSGRSSWEREKQRTPPETYPFLTNTSRWTTGVHTKP